MITGERTPAPGTAPSKAISGARPALRYRPDWALIAPPAVTLAVMLWSIGAPSNWRDETASLPPHWP